MPVGSLRQALALFDSSVSHSDAAEAAVGQDMTSIVRVVVFPFSHWGFPHLLTLFSLQLKGGHSIHRQRDGRRDFNDCRPSMT